MNEFDRVNMQGRSIDSELCPFCGRMASNLHHIVPRSRGGARGPLVPVCGMGNASGCHKRLHDHTLTMRWAGECWEYLETEGPTKVDDAMQMEGWRRL